MPLEPARDSTRVRQPRRAAERRVQGASDFPSGTSPRGGPSRDGGPHSLVRGRRPFYQASGSDPLLLESVFNDPALRSTNFVLVHGGGMYAAHAGAMLWKPNVYVDFSVMDLIYSPTKLARVLEDWLVQFPDKVLFGTDASGFGPDIGWELAAWVGTTTARRALAIALTDMMRSGSVSRARAEEIATMVLRTNAAKLYNLRLP